MTTEIIQQPTIVYPERDGKPVGETDDHRDLTFDLVFSLRNWLRGQAAYVSGNLMMYYEEGVPSSVISPDVFVIFGVPQRKRRVYKTWENTGLFPQVVIEITSASTRFDDLGTKRVLYADLGVQEYYLFDPLGEYLKPQLRGYQLVDGELIPLPGPQMFSQLLKLELRTEGRQLRLYDLQTGQRLAFADDLETEVQRLQAEIERLRKGS